MKVLITGGAGYNTVIGFAGSAELSISDFLGNHRFYLTTDLFTSSLDETNFLAVYNSLAGEKRLFVGEADHYEWTGAERQGARLFREQCEWFTSARTAAPAASRVSVADCRSR